MSCTPEFPVRPSDLTGIQDNFLLLGEVTAALLQKKLVGILLLGWGGTCPPIMHHHVQIIHNQPPLLSGRESEVPVRVHLLITTTAGATQLICSALGQGIDGAVGAKAVTTGSQLDKTGVDALEDDTVAHITMCKFLLCLCLVPCRFYSTNFVRTAAVPYWEGDMRDVRMAYRAQDWQGASCATTL